VKQAKVVLIEAGPRILPSFPEDLAHSAVEQLAELGVDVKTGARVVSIDRDGVTFEEEGADDMPGLGKGNSRDRLATDTVLWGAGVRASDLAKSLGVPLDRQGRIIVGPDCAIPEHRNVFSIGDMAHFEEKGEILPGVSPVAMQQGRYVARLIKNDLHHDASHGDVARKPFSYFDKGSMATIGRSRAIAWARGIKMHGFIAWLAWLFIHIWYLIGFRSRFVVLATWIWSYLSYKRGARLITRTGWLPSQTPTSNSSSAALPSLPTSTSPHPVLLEDRPLHSDRLPRTSRSVARG